MRFALGFAAAGLAVLFAVAGAMAEPPASAENPCEVPVELRGLRAGLPHTAEAVRAGQALTIVALGSSSTVGVGASSPAKSYPAQLAAALRQAWPGLAVTVHNEGVGGETTDQMLARLDRSVLVHRPQLVIWQMGSNGLLEDRDIALHADLLRRGIARIEAAGADIVLMDPQYAPRLLAKARVADVVAGISTVAAETKVGLLRRFDAMRYWVVSGRHAMEALIDPDRLHMTDLGYTCVARLLADGVVTATRSAPAVAAIVK